MKNDSASAAKNRRDVIVRRMAMHLFGVACAISTTLVQANPVLYSIGPDANGVGRVLTPISTNGGGVTLGDGSVAFNGGLAFRPSDSSLFTISNDSFGQSSLAIVDPASGTISNSVAIGTGFSGGLAFDGANDIDALGSDFTGLSSLFSLDPATGAATNLGTLGYGFAGGLAFDSGNRALHAFAADAFGVQDAFVRIDLGSAGASATTLFELGADTISFNGGLAYDSTNDDFLAIGNDAFGNSTLYAFSATDPSSLTAEYPVGAGYVNAGLALAFASTTPPSNPAGTVPEPETPLLIVAVLIGLLARDRLRFLSFRINPRSVT